MIIRYRVIDMSNNKYDIDTVTNTYIPECLLIYIHSKLKYYLFN